MKLKRITWWGAGALSPEREVEDMAINEGICQLRT
jgi:hypothetical protein